LLQRKVIFYLLITTVFFSYVPISLASSNFTWPCKGLILNFFKSESHRGIDIEAPVGTPVKAIASGTVKWVGKTPRGESYISIEHPGGISSTYLPVKVSNNIRKGVVVEREQIIGTISSEGDISSDLPHLHLGLYLTSSRGNKEYLDPLEYLPPLLQAGRGETLPKTGEIPVGVSKDNLAGGTNLQLRGRVVSWLDYRSEETKTENGQLRNFSGKSRPAQRVVRLDPKQESLKNFELKSTFSFRQQKQFTLTKAAKPKILYKTRRKQILPNRGKFPNWGKSTLPQAGLTTPKGRATSLAKQIYLPNLTKVANISTTRVERKETGVNQSPLKKIIGKQPFFSRRFYRLINSWLKEVLKFKFFSRLVLLLLLGGIVWRLRNIWSIFILSRMSFRVNFR
jgi:hypothetical protein